MRQLMDEATTATGRRIFYRAIMSLLVRSSSESCKPGHAADLVATPGGITEAGLKAVQELSPELRGVFEKMRRRADELRVKHTEIEKPNPR